jgi:hypothetical protein
MSNALAMIEAGQSVTVLNAPLVPAVIEAFRTSELCRLAMHDESLRLPYIGDHDARFVDRARELRERCLPYAAKARQASKALTPIVSSSEAIEPEHAVKMFSLLYGTLNKKRTDDDAIAMKLASCVEMFSPVSNQIGELTGLWKPVPQHPVIIALAIKQLIGEEVFAPEPSEVAKACRHAHQRLSVHLHWTDEWLAKLNLADGILLEFAPHDEWERPYLLPEYRPVLTWMLEDHAMLSGADCCDPDDDGLDASRKRSETKRSRKPKGA